MPASAWISQVFWASFPVVGSGNEAPGSVRDRVGPPTSGWIPPPPQKMCSLWTSESCQGLASLHRIEKGSSQSLCSYEIFLVLAILKNKPLPPPSCVQPWSEPFGGWEVGDWLRRKGFGVTLSEIPVEEKRCQLISSLFRLKGWWIFFPGYC